MIGTDCWKTYKLGDCVNFLSGGTPSKKKPEYWDGNIPWVSCKDMKKAYLYDSQDHITEKGAANGTRFVSPETILIVVRGMILGQHFPVAIAKRKMAFNQDLKALQCAPNVDPTFLFHWLRGKSYEILGIVDEAAHGTKRLQTDRLQNFPLHLPPLPIQRKIAAILSAYDRLIENNTRRIEIMEEMARSLYREWFVKFRFPGHEQVQMVDSELGLIPEGWEIKHLPDICSKVIDGTHDSPKPVNEGYYLVTGKHIVNGFIDFSKCYFISHEEHKKVMKRSKPEKGDTIFSNIGTLGSTAIVEENFEFSIKNVALFKPLEEIHSCFIYLYFSSPETLETMEKKASGTSQRFFSLKLLRELDLVVPPNVVFYKFNSFVRPILEERSLLNKKNHNLRKTRDLLLPRLISGEIDVENLDINTGEIAA